MYSHIYINIYIFYLTICISDTYSVYNPSRSIKSNYWEWQRKHTYLWNSQVNVLYLVFSLGMLHQEWSMTLQCTNQMKLNKMGRIPQVVSFSSILQITSRLVCQYHPLSVQLHIQCPIDWAVCTLSDTFSMWRTHCEKFQFFLRATLDQFQVESRIITLGQYGLLFQVKPLLLLARQCWLYWCQANAMVINSRKPALVFLSSWIKGDTL